MGLASAFALWLRRTKGAIAFPLNPGISSPLRLGGLVRRSPQGGDGSGTASSRNPAAQGALTPRPRDTLFLIANGFLELRNFLAMADSIMGDGRSVALGPAASAFAKASADKSPLLRVRRFARPSAADRPGVPALPTSRCCARLFAASGD